jgi:hypothetical protein
MRIRTLLALGVGAAVGAGVTYLGDPDHGDARRVEARRWALSQGRQHAAALARRALATVRTAGDALAEGYQESRSLPDVDDRLH